MPGALPSFPSYSTSGPSPTSTAASFPGQTTTFQAGAPGDIGSLTALINSLNVGGQTSANAARIPGGPALEAQSSGNISQELAGQVPADVINLLGQQAAERGIGMGSPGSANTNAEYLQSLGLTSLGLEQTGQQDLTAALNRNQAAPLFDPTSQLMTPYQAGQLNLQEQGFAAQQAQQALENSRYKQGSQLMPGPGGGGGGSGSAWPGGGGSGNQFGLYSGGPGDNLTPIIGGPLGSDYNYNNPATPLNFDLSSYGNTYGNVSPTDTSGIDFGGGMGNDVSQQVMDYTLGGGQDSVLPGIDTSLYSDNTDYWGF